MSDKKTFVFKLKNKIIGEYQLGDTLFKFRKPKMTEKAEFSRDASILAGVISTLLVATIEDRSADILDYKGDKIGQYNPKTKSMTADIPVGDYKVLIQYLISLTEETENLNIDGEIVDWKDLDEETKEEILEMMGENKLYEFIIAIMVKSIMIENNITESAKEDKEKTLDEE